MTERFLSLAESIVRVRGADPSSIVLLPRSEETEYGSDDVIAAIARDALEDVVKRWVA